MAALGTAPGARAAATASAPTIVLDRATVRHGRSVLLTGFSGTFAPGTVTALVGGDGAGKTTLLKLLAGRLTAAHLGGSGLPLPRHAIGYQPADAGVWRNLSVAENLEFVRGAYGLDRARARGRGAELLERAGLSEFRHRVAGRLSGGMRQKLGVVLATLHQPGLVLLDEPTTGVDPISRAELWTLIAASAAEGATVVFATTYLDEAERATRLELLADGEQLASGTPDEIVAQTPGRIVRAPADSVAGAQLLAAPHSWRRAETVYSWSPPPDPGSAPALPASASASASTPTAVLPEPAAPDLENSCVALLLAHSHAERHAPPVWPSARTTAPGRARRGRPAPARERRAGVSRRTHPGTRPTRRGGQRHPALRGVHRARRCLA
ncbi:ABC transporter ATP-binding protein [Leucobacter luti]|uniref:ABC-type multidrug transport system ATPase subunit n=1 Tax=Leucobacter luti TaxID=340320 RepID=A0A4Q7TK94_9MICO|nr:ABC transporter ATP-binding protein [Leucobacter luti]MBL3700416.1 ABC transporter ATP-binding protein [Leucobacter luti]RZT60587.1 ABC-type multidrug transport system ATPase subunit [Leucobacter luti]